MINIFLLTTLFLLVIANFVYRFKRKMFYEKDILKQQHIVEMAKIKYRLLDMAELKELNPNSAYFRFMYTSTRYLIRTLWVNGFSSETSNLNIIKKSLYDFCAEGKESCKNQCLFQEIKDLNFEQKELLCRVSLAVLDVFKNSSLYNFALYHIFAVAYNKNYVKLTFMLPFFIAIKEIVAKIKPEIIVIYGDYKEINQYTAPETCNPQLSKCAA
jgi:hypothetical protein